MIRNGLEEFGSLVGVRPLAHANHCGNRENIYWGNHRLSSTGLQLIYDLATIMRRNHHSLGHLPGSEYFWGDLCKERIEYVRNFVFDEINLDRMNPTMPYHDPARPFVNYWFSSCEGGDVESFCRTLSAANQDRLESEGGVCIMYTYFASGFFNGGGLHPRFQELMKRLAKKNSGWFVPVSTLLNHLRSEQRDNIISRQEQGKLEAHWVLTKLQKETTRRARSHRFTG